MSSRKGLGSDASRPAALITPCPAAINQFFEEQLHYSNLNKKVNNKEPFIVTYTKGLTYADHPVFECLKGVCCYSFIKVDLWSGNVVDSWFQFKNLPTTIPSFFPHSFNGIRSFADLETLAKGSELHPISDEVYEALIWVFKWHLNIVHMTREYLKGGWLYRRQRRENLEATKEKYVILNKKGFTNILNNAKPDNVEFLGNGRVK